MHIRQFSLPDHQENLICIPESETLELNEFVRVALESTQAFRAKMIGPSGMLTAEGRVKRMSLLVWFYLKLFLGRCSRESWT